MNLKSKDTPMKLDFAPFQDWLKDRYERYGTVEELCNATGLSRRRVECYLQGRQFDKRIKDPTIRNISIDVVDKALITEWSTGLWELYPALYS